MTSATQQRTFSAATGSRIDTATGTIRGVSLITEGPALGHEVFIDSRTLAQVKASAEAYQGGLKVKMDHAGGAGDIIGYIDGLRIVGAKLLGDLHLLETSEHRAYVLEIAERIPDTFGLSLAFSGAAEEVGKKMMQRCTEIYSCDLVAEPAANPGGLFSRGLFSDRNRTGEPLNSKMDTPASGVALSAEQFTQALAQFTARLEKLEAFAFPPAADPNKDKEDPAACMSRKVDEAVKLALKDLTKTFSTPAAPASPAAPVAPPAKSATVTFAQIVATKTLELKGDKAAAISAAVKSNPTEYAAYREQFGRGELVLL
jgi:hypothetical protein